MTSVMEAIALLDAVLGIPDARQVTAYREEAQERHLFALGLLPGEMGGIATKGCGKCGGTMYRTEDTDGSGLWVCSECGKAD